MEKTIFYKGYGETLCGITLSRQPSVLFLKISEKRHSVLNYSLFSVHRLTLVCENCYKPIFVIQLYSYWYLLIVQKVFGKNQYALELIAF